MKGSSLILEIPGCMQEHWFMGGLDPQVGLETEILPWLPRGRFGKHLRGEALRVVHCSARPGERSQTVCTWSAFSLCTLTSPLHSSRVLALISA